MVKQRLMNMAAMLLVGDGILTALRPKKETILWESGPRVYRTVMEKFAERPNLARAFGLMELGVGIWMAARQWDRQKSA